MNILTFPTHNSTAPIVLTPEFAEKISNFNRLTREMRAADIRIEAMSFLDNKIFIHQTSAARLADHFRKELRGIRHKIQGRNKRNVVTIRGVDVTWFTPVEEHKHG